MLAIEPAVKGQRGKTITRPGPKAGHTATLATRLAHVLCKIGKMAPGRMVKIPLGSLAQDLACSRETLRRLTLRHRSRAWFFQDFHTVVMMTHETSENTPRGRWFLWVANRHSMHRIHAAPGRWRRLRWHLRKGAASDWQAFCDRLREWAFAMLSLSSGRDEHHKASPLAISPRANGARAPGTIIDPPNGGLEGVAAKIVAAYASTSRPVEIKLYGWIRNRLSEYHGAGDILRALEHATALCRKRRTIQTANPAAWVCGVARHTLNYDGLVPIQRRRKLQQSEGRALPRPAFNGQRRIEPSGEIFTDADGAKWQNISGTNWQKI